MVHDHAVSLSRRPQQCQQDRDAFVLFPGGTTNFGRIAVGRSRFLRLNLEAGGSLTLGQIPLWEYLHFGEILGRRQLVQVLVAETIHRGSPDELTSRADSGPRSAPLAFCLLFSFLLFSISFSLD